MVDHAKIGRKSKNKGKAYERLVAKKLTDFTGVGFRKTPGSGGFNKAGGVVVAGHIFCGDLICDSPDFKYSVEAKNRKGFAFRQILKNAETCSFTKWWFQACRDAQDVGLEPMLWFKPQEGSPDNLVAIRRRQNVLYHVVKPNGIALQMYQNAVKFDIIEKSPGEKKKRKHLVEAKLPIPMVYHWSEIEKNWDPKEFFQKAIPIENLLEIISYD